MTSAVYNQTTPLIYLPGGVARTASGASDGATSAATGSYKAGASLRLSSLEDRQSLIIREFRSETVHLAEGLRLFEVPDLDQLSTYRRAVSSNPDSFTAIAQSGLEESRHYVRVQNTAQVQVNTGRRFIADQAAETTAGDYTLELTINDETQDFTVTVNGDETNEELLKKIGRQISAVDGRLDVRVEESSTLDENGLDVRQSYLVIEADEPDTDFYLADSEGDLTDSLGLDRSSTRGAPARLHFDHLLQLSEDNAYTTPDGEVTVFLHDTSGTGETLSVRRGWGALREQAEELVGQYNEYMDFLSNNREFIKPVLSEKISEEADQAQRRLISVGIAPAGEGGLEITGRFPSLLLGRPDQVREALTGPEGFFTGVRTILDEALERGLGDYARKVSAPARNYSHTAGSAQFMLNGAAIAALV